MGSTDTNRIDHDFEKSPTTFRDRRLDTIIEDLNEEESGAGFSEVVRTGVFVDLIIVWDSPAKSKMRTRTDFTRTGPFLTTATKKIYDEDTGLIQIASISVTVARNADQSIKDVSVARTRP
jgi:hypothetical protein